MQKVMKLKKESVFRDEFFRVEVFLPYKNSWVCEAVLYDFDMAKNSLKFYSTHRFGSHFPCDVRIVSVCQKLTVYK